MVNPRIIRTAYCIKGDKLLKELIANNYDLKNGDIIINHKSDGTNDIYVYCNDAEPTLNILEYEPCDMSLYEDFPMS